MSKKRVVIDMDEVIADIYAKFIRIFNQNHGLSLTLEQLEQKETYEVLPPQLLEQWSTYINEIGFFRDLPVITDAQEVIRALQDKYEVYIVSAAMQFPNSLKDKYDWLAEHFPFIQWQYIVLCGHKIVDADIMIDDRSYNLDAFRGERKLLFSSPHNHKQEGYERVDTWQDVAQKLL